MTFVVIIQTVEAASLVCMTTLAAKRFAHGVYCTSNRFASWHCTAQDLACSTIASRPRPARLSACAAPVMVGTRKQPFQ